MVGVAVLRKGLAMLNNRTVMETALEAAAQVRTRTSPNPWVGAVVLSPAGDIVGVGATEPPGGAHAEVIALRAAGLSFVDVLTAARKRYDMIHVVIIAQWLLTARA